MKLTNEQIEWLNSCHGWAYLKGKWTFNEETGLVDVDGDFKTPNSHNSCKALGRNGGKRYRSIADFMGIKFGTVTGDFDCSYNNLTNLEGAPIYVGGNFWCCDRWNDPHLESLQGAEECIIGGDFDCHYNKLKRWILILNICLICYP